MATNPFLVMDTETIQPVAGVAPKDAVASNPEAEPGAAGHWVYGVDRASLIGLDRAWSTNQGDALTFSAGGVTLAEGPGEAIATDVRFGAGQSATYAGYVTRPAALSNVIVMMGDRDNAGSYAYLRGGDRLSCNTGAGVIPGDLVLTADIPQFFALSMDHSTAVDNVILYVGGQVAEVYSQDLSAATVSWATVHIGNGFFSDDDVGSLIFHEAMIFPTAKSVVDLDAIYVRSQARMTARGVIGA